MTRLGDEELGGAEGNRTLDLLNAIQALSQLSYGPTRGMQDGKDGAFLLRTAMVLRNIDKQFAKVKSAIHNLLDLPDLTFPQAL